MIGDFPTNCHFHGGGEKNCLTRKNEHNSLPLQMVKSSCTRIFFTGFVMEPSLGTPMQTNIQ